MTYRQAFITPAIAYASIGKKNIISRTEEPEPAEPGDKGEVKPSGGGCDGGFMSAAAFLSTVALLAGWLRGGVKKTL